MFEGKTCDSKITLHGCNAGVTSVEFDVQVSAHEYVWLFFSFFQKRTKNNVIINPILVVATPHLTNLFLFTFLYLKLETYYP